MASGRGTRDIEAELARIRRHLAECKESKRQVHMEVIRAAGSRPEEVKRLVDQLVRLGEEETRLTAQELDCMAAETRRQLEQELFEAQQGRKRKRVIYEEEDDDDKDSDVEEIAVVGDDVGNRDNDNEDVQQDEDGVVLVDEDDDDDDARWIGRQITPREREILDHEASTSQSLADHERWRNIWNMVVEYRGWSGKVHERIAFAADDVYAAATKSITVLLSQCQSDKTIAEGIIAALARSKGRPNVLLVADVNANARNVATNVAALLGELHKCLPESCVHFMDGTQRAARQIEDPMYLNSFLKGELTLVVPTYESAMTKFANFVVKKNIRNMHLSIDEADQMWKNEPNNDRWPYFQGRVPHPKRRRVGDDDAAVAREPKLYGTAAERILYNHILREGVPAPGKRVASLCLISATHMSTVRIIDLLPEFKAVAHFATANDELLRLRGYSAESDMVRWTVDDEVQTISEDDCKQKKEFGIKTDVATRFFTAFRDDDRVGKMMLVATSRLVNVSGGASGKCLSLSDQAQYYLEIIDPTAVCIIVHGGGVFLSTEPGVEEKLFSIHNNRLRLRDIGEAIARFDNNMERSVMIFGYNMVGRSASIRSNVRVITHAFISYGNRSLSNWYQGADRGSFVEGILGSHSRLKGA